MIVIHVILEQPLGMNHYCDGTSGTYRCKAGFECQNAGRMSVCECPTNEYWDGSACRKIFAKFALKYFFLKCF